MRLLFLTQFYPPDMGAAAGRVRAHCLALAEGGYRVRVLVPFASYPAGRLQPQDRKRLLKSDTDQGVRVIRYRPIFVGKKAFPVRLIAEAWVAFITFLLGLCLALRSGIIVATSPSPLVGITGALFKRCMPRKRFVLEVRDLTWQYAFELGKVRNSRIKVMTMAVVRWMARSADMIIVTNQVQRTYFLQMGIALERVQVVYNGVSADGLAVEPLPVGQVKACTEVTYVGLVGYAQGLRTLVEVADLARQAGLAVRFRIVGDGAELPAVQELIRERNLTSVETPGACPPAELARHYRESDVLFAQLRDKPVFGSALPSKLLEYMSTGRPVVFAGAGPGAELLREAGAGVVAAPENAESILAAIRQLLELDPQERRRVGECGRAFVAGSFLRSQTATAFVKAVGGD